VPEHDERELDWRTSTRSAQSDCVEVAFVDDGVLVRDSKDRSGPVLEFTTEQWRGFLRHLTSEE
jgi:hypothetical protein